MTTFGIVSLAVLVTATAGGILWWLQKFLGSEMVRATLTGLVVLGWLVFGYLWVAEVGTTVIR